MAVDGQLILAIEPCTGLLGDFFVFMKWSGSLDIYEVRGMYEVFVCRHTYIDIDIDIDHLPSAFR
jgi:hypothetical protein